MSGDKVIALSDATFESEVLASDRPVLVKFEAPWCGPCKAMKPTIDEIAQEYGDKVKVTTLDIDANNKTPHRFGIRGVPTFLVFDRGNVAGQKVGLARKAELANLLDPLIAETPSPSP
jgi:thioredoxin 1